MRHRNLLSTKVMKTKYGPNVILILKLVVTCTDNVSTYIFNSKNIFFSSLFTLIVNIYRDDNEMYKSLC